MATIDISENDNIEIAIRKFRKEVEKEAIVKEIKERQFFKKQSQVKREERDRLEKRIKRKEKKRKRQLDI